MLAMFEKTVNFSKCMSWCKLSFCHTNGWKQNGIPSFFLSTLGLPEPIVGGVCKMLNVSSFLHFCHSFWLGCERRSSTSSALNRQTPGLWEQSRTNDIYRRLCSAAKIMSDDAIGSEFSHHIVAFPLSLTGIIGRETRTIMQPTQDHVSMRGPHHANVEDIGLLKHRTKNRFGKCSAT